MTRARKAPEVKNRATNRNDSGNEKVINPEIQAVNVKESGGVMTAINMTEGAVIPTTGGIPRKEKTGIMITMKENRSILLQEHRLTISTGFNFGFVF